MDVRGKVAVVTGGSRGIGAAIAKMLASSGAIVAIGYRRSEQAAAQVVDDIRRAGGQAHMFQGDLTTVEDAERLASEVHDQLGQVSVLVNNAGTILRPDSWNEQNLESIDKSIHLNLRAPILLIRLFAPDMIAAGEGNIINMSSTYGITGAAAVLSYTASKAAIISVTYSMARELGSKGVRVNAIVPGNIDTQLTQGAGQDVLDWTIETTPLGRLGTVEEVASGAKFLLENDFVTGHTLILDGGQILNM